MNSIVFILGTPYCGSTFLANLLAQFDGVFNIGELDRIIGIGNNNNPLTTYLCEVCAAKEQLCPIFTHDLIDSIKEAPSHYERYNIFSQIGNTKVLLDGSKHAYWLDAVCTDKSVHNRARPIILARHPIRFVLSSMRRHVEYNRPAWKWCEIWRDTYFDILRTCNYNGLPFLVVRHEDLTAAPVHMLESIKNFCGLDSNSTSILEHSFHYIGGNPEFTARLIEEPNPKSDHVSVDFLSEEYLNVKNALFNTPGVFDLCHNIFAYELV